MLTEFEIGMGVMWFNESDCIRRGVVLDNNGSLEVVPVFAAGYGIKCYDEGGADPIKDRHNGLTQFVLMTMLLSILV